MGYMMFACVRVSKWPPEQCPLWNIMVFDSILPNLHVREIFGQAPLKINMEPKNEGLKQDLEAARRCVKTVGLWWMVTTWAAFTLEHWQVNCTCTLNVLRERKTAWLYRNNLSVFVYLTDFPMGRYRWSLQWSSMDSLSWLILVAWRVPLMSLGCDLPTLGNSPKKTTVTPWDGNRQYLRWENCHD